MEGFSVIYRNPGHWDIGQSGKRIFRIRGGPGEYSVYDERESILRKSAMEFYSVQAAMSYITDILMSQLIVAEGQSPIIIESWNV